MARVFDRFSDRDVILKSPFGVHRQLFPKASSPTSTPADFVPQGEYVVAEPALLQQRQIQPQAVAEEPPPAAFHCRA